MDLKDAIVELVKRTKEKYGDFGKLYIQSALTYCCEYTEKIAVCNLDTHVFNHAAAKIHATSYDDICLWYDSKRRRDKGEANIKLVEYIDMLNFLCMSTNMEPLVETDMIVAYVLKDEPERCAEFAKLVLDTYVNINPIADLCKDLKLLKQIDEQMTALDQKEKTVYDPNIMSNYLDGCCRYIYQSAVDNINAIFHKPKENDSDNHKELDDLRSDVNNLYFIGVTAEKPVLVDVVGKDISDEYLKSFAKTVLENYLTVEFK